ncbi:hypothetical protein X798_07882 [Onchocerca flexuosa]|uniref:Uncharacterized protein n=2 Tax=Onchocerca flexuosa TaxID=387005 RepID=A0A183I6Z4_9BILA|nr:hypothetical protein X798_07882 [Onchocerca flexuosa]VDP22242.1 unnamed protein product [Onchocerca flexuosa]
MQAAQQSANSDHYILSHGLLEGSSNLHLIHPLIDLSMLRTNLAFIGQYQRNILGSFETSRHISDDAVKSFLIPPTITSTE